MKGRLTFIIFVGLIQKNSKCCFSGSLACDILKGDERSMPGPLNFDTPGGNINLFSSITVPVSGRVKHVLFYARRSRNVYVSFWKTTGVQHEFEMEAKIEIINQEAGRVVSIFIHIDFIRSQNIMKCIQEINCK